MYFIFIKNFKNKGKIMIENNFIREYIRVKKLYEKASFLAHDPRELAEVKYYYEELEKVKEELKKKGINYKNIKI
jgi:transcriptional/translational regulatory protein YebC/TACO1